MRTRKDASPTDLSQVCNEPLITMSHHITTLRKAGLVELAEQWPGAVPSNIATRSPPHRE